MTVQNTTVLVIGGTSGIGLGVARAVADRGATVIVASRRRSSVDRALAELPAGARGTTVDLADPGALDRLVDEVGEVDHLVYTAGEPLEMSALADLTPDAVVGFLSTRFIGALSAVRVFGPRLRAGGSITLTSGTAAWSPGYGVLPSSLCGAMNAMTAALAVELAPIRVNAVAPGLIRTPLWDAVPEAERQELYDEDARRVPLGRVGEVADVARAYVYCMEQEFSTGTVLTVEGGILLV
ncbi:SDR family oxidoreductase [Mycobacterium yunnanensis]|uniref:SDR family oxidoreductase n=1 Tax=Mycobacterium yunnanensis TaxID=368477 RepID=A0A9X2Z2M4_9MYCO|nr:SDR family oxidoreductase [Mycobacterium yunnanensis]MCV7421696.1 SDR family oxidoreductase [Mycobacterium yunnanensis]